jgi:hypothetical protein
VLDTSRLVPPARSIVETAAAIYIRHTQHWFVGLLVHGSALKGDFIPGCSDIDFHLYLDKQAFSASTGLPLETCLSIQRDLAELDPAPFRYIQCQAFLDALPEEQIGPIPGAYLLLAGGIPVTLATQSQLREAARKRLAGLDAVSKYVVDSLLEHGKERLSWHVRWLCTQVWPTVYQVLVLQGREPFSIWRLPKTQALALLPPETPLGQTIRAFHQAVQTYYPSEKAVEEGLAVISTGVSFLQTAASWWQEQQSSNRKRNPS